MTTYPNLNAAWNHMLEDQGIHYSADVSFPRATLADYADAELESMDAALGKLSPEELETICIGDQEEWPEIIAKHFPGAEWPEIHAILDELFMEAGDMSCRRRQQLLIAGVSAFLWAVVALATFWTPSLATRPTTCYSVPH